MGFQTWLTVIAAWVITEVALGTVLKKAPLWLSGQSIAAFRRLFKEITLLHSVLHNNTRFTRWNPKTPEYDALRAIKVQGKDQPVFQSVLDSLESYLRRSEPVVLLGDPGAGKTTALEALTYRLARQALLQVELLLSCLILVALLLLFVAPALSLIWLASFFLWESLVHRATVPLFLDARRDYRGDSVSEWIQDTQEKELGEKPLFGWRNRTVLVVDGINEVPTSLYETFVDDWCSVLQRKHRFRIIFSSRTGQDPTAWLGLDSTLTICALDDTGVQKLLEVYERRRSLEEGIPYEVDRVKHDFEELQGKRLLDEKGIGRNPFWLEKLVMSGLRTSNQGRLFWDSAKRLVGRETEEKPRDRERHSLWERIVPTDVEMDALGNLALAMHKEKRVGFIGETLWNKANMVIKKSISDLPYSVYDVLYEAQAATLVRFSRNEYVEFVHPLVQDFFAAYALRMPDKWTVLEEHVEDHWWWQTIFMLGGIARDHQVFVRQVLGDGENGTRVLLSFGLLDSVEKLNLEDDPHIIEELRQSSSELDQAQTVEMLSQLRKLRQVSNEVNQVMEVLSFSPRGKWRVLASPLNPFTEIEYDVTLALAYPLARGATEEYKDSLRELSRITGKVIIDRLASFLVSEDDWIKKEVIGFLKSFGETKAAEYIVLALGDNEVRDVAHDALVEMGASAVKPLIQALAWDQKSWLEGSAEIQEETTARMHEAKAQIARWLEVMKDPAFAKVSDPKMVRLLRKQLSAYEEMERLSTQFASGIQPIMRLLQESSETQLIRQVAQHFTESLQQANLPELVEYLRTEELLSRRVPDSQLVIDTLAEIGEPAVELLIQALSCQNLFGILVPGRAAKALGKIGSRSAIQALADKLDDRHLVFHVDEILRGIGEPAIDVLIDSLNSSEPFRSLGAYKILRDIGQPVVDPLIEAMRSGRAELLGMNLLCEIGSTPENLDHLVAALGSGSVSLKLAAGQALEMMDESTIDRPIAALDEEELSRSAVRVLANMGSSAVEPLIRALSHSSAAVRAGVLEALDRIGFNYGIDDERLVRLIIEALRSEEDERVWNRAMHALASIGASAIDPLGEFMHDPDPRICRFAWGSLTLMAAYFGTIPKSVIAALEDENPDIRLRAVVCVGVGSDLSTIRPLVRRIPYEPWKLRLAIMRFLPQIIIRSAPYVGRRARNARELKRNRASYQDHLARQRILGEIWGVDKSDQRLEKDNEADHLEGRA